MQQDYRLDKMNEECGVFGIYDNNKLEVANLIYCGLYALQHRGQESAGIAINDNGSIIHHKNMGLVPEVFNKVILNHMKGQIGVGHVRYSTTGDSRIENAQPMVIKFRDGDLALTHNGNLVNANEIRKDLEKQGTIFQSSNDTEVIANLISRYTVATNSIEESLKSVVQDIKGSYALAMMTPDSLIGIRDPLGIRPLCLGKIDESYVISSESCAIDAVGGKFIRDIKPGEIVIINKDGIKSIQTAKTNKTSLCIFEFVYFARPDSYIDGVSVCSSRIEAGRILAREHPVEADIVIGAPDGGLNAALGYARESGIPYGQGLLKNRYVGRTFIQPDQGQREAGVKLKFNAMKSEIEGKKVIMVDDSIVRGTTTGRIVQMLKDAGAKEVHMRISSPPYKYPCFFGIDTATRNQLVASKNSVEDIRKMIGADSLGYLSLEGLLSSPKGAKCDFCTACFNGKYPMEVPDEGDKLLFSK